MRELHIPLDVPPQLEPLYRHNWNLATRASGRLMLMAGDQKVEHLNDDFIGSEVDEADGDPEHLFRIASRARIGCFAAQPGLISRYGRDYPEIPYLLKLNAKTKLVKTEQADPVSRLWHGIDQVKRLREQGQLQIVGVGYTIYPGSSHEAEMLSEAARLVFEAHQAGLLAVLWIYPRGQAVTDEHDAHLIAGCAGLGACLGADFVKVNPPAGPITALREAVRAAGRTGVICAGGHETDAESFLERLHAQREQAGVAGSATGRNIHQRPLEEAVRFCNAITSLTCEHASLEEALAKYRVA